MIGHLDPKEQLIVLKEYDRIGQLGSNLILRNDLTDLAEIKKCLNTSNKLLKAEAAFMMYWHTNDIEYAKMFIEARPILFSMYDELEDTNFNEIFEQWLDVADTFKNKYNLRLGLETRTSVIIKNHNDTQEYRNLLRRYFDTVLNLPLSLEIDDIIKDPKNAKLYIQVYVEKVLETERYKELKYLLKVLKSNNLKALEEIALAEMSKAQKRAQSLQEFIKSLNE